MLLLVTEQSSSGMYSSIQMDTKFGYIKLPIYIICPCVVSFGYMFYFDIQVVHGKTMEDWLRFSVCYWHTFRGVGKLCVPTFTVSG